MNHIQIRQICSDVFRYAYNSDKRIKEPLAEFYKIGKESPCVANIIMSDVEDKAIRRYGKEAGERLLFEGSAPLKDFLWKTGMAAINRVEADESDEIKLLKEAFDKSFKDLYPKTAELRQKLIDIKRVVFDEVLPKATLKEKRKIMKMLKK